jgi:hypothetical protein
VHSYDDPSHVDWSQIYIIPKVIEKSICPACVATNEFSFLAVMGLNALILSVVLRLRGVGIEKVIRLHSVQGTLML